MEKAESAVEQAMRGRFCALAHDINNALNVISGYCEIMAEEAGPGSECEPRLRQIVSIVQKIAKRINGHECRMTLPATQSTLDPENVRKPIRSEHQTPVNTSVGDVNPSLNSPPSACWTANAQPIIQPHDSSGEPASSAAVKVCDDWK